MDDYSTKIKNSAEHLIRNEFPGKALELDILVSVCYKFQSNYIKLYLSYRVQYYHLMKYQKFVLKFNYQQLMILLHI